MGILIVALPGFLVGLLLWVVLREPQATQGARRLAPAQAHIMGDGDRC